MIENTSRAGGREPKDSEVITVARPRVSPTSASHAARGGRPKTIRQPWSFNLLVICLSMCAGVVAGTYLMRAIRVAKLAHPAPSVEGGEAANSAPESLIAEPAADERQRSSTASLPETLATAAPLRTDGAKPPTRMSPQAVPSKSRRVPSAEPASTGTAPATVRAAPPSAGAAQEKTVEARRDLPAADPGATSTGARLILAWPRAVPPPPVPSPAPANKSERRKVVP